MKQAVFKPEWYVSPEYAEYERVRVFEKLWLAAGFSSAIRNNGDYFVLMIHGQRVLVHRLGDEIVAYVDACPHRGGVIATAEMGNTRPVCKYHGWAFREGRDLTGVPMGAQFENDAALRDRSCGRRLKPLAVHCVGPLIFVNLDERPLPFEEQFSPELIAWFERMGQTSTMIQLGFKCDYNWKLNAENVRDTLHPFFVHADSFSSVLPAAVETFNQDRMVRLHPTADEDYARDETPPPALRELSFVWMPEFDEGSYWYDGLLRRSLPQDRFVDMLLFPNTNLYSVGGRYYAMQQYLPTSATTFDYRLSIAMPQMLRRFDAQPLLTSIARSERHVIDEDSIILRRVQQNLAAMSQRRFRFTQGDYETPIMQFMRYMGEVVYQESQADHR
ncbi:aromatic ring-hydroxylating oxygenase subunit alpha [Bordetella pseudohinzii]|uniref:Anthranilate 1,2-dioxygenase large subunit n=1 Tax=Bordetella pseudohinzii TaxID=1331258 RepID=A0A0J6BVK0_9BORD|nr:SRPBCC family protein [Bordetella pseudohinzii]ANY14785.1 ring-hydroxylating oxygenase subunit alpha [Bordetella pseudohinzii]KMM25804.1 dioxygenase [Bordetella pseudohinzii]KXA77698.1 ring-hydroxylating oxygenase subunit alpha [Bordetella pseudohinzii]KXA79350.1 ring-hydroxylating oxygenase subunit alpha [Bordetella pseudohinzii]CUJ15811.1 Anthranilate 1%2C2-dioxygenase large subunit [Bordetella pseudohinzii]